LSAFRIDPLVHLLDLVPYPGVASLGELPVEAQIEGPERLHRPDILKTVEPEESLQAVVFYRPAVRRERFARDLQPTLGCRAVEKQYPAIAAFLVRQAVERRALRKREPRCKSRANNAKTSPG
jgi:hypothetical protein